MKQSIILGIGTGRCGLASLAKILNKQPDAQCSFEDPPLLPWTRIDTPSPPAPLPLGEGTKSPSPSVPFPKGEGTNGIYPKVDEGTNLPSPPAPLPEGEGSCETRVRRIIRERFARFHRFGRARLLGDAASFYLPYLEDAIDLEPDIRIVCLRRPREDVVASFCEWLDQTMPLPTNHWARKPAPGWHHDPNRTRTFPQYDTQNREEGIRRYWDEYYRKVDELIGRYPEHIRLMDTYESLNTENGQREMLSFLGIAPDRQNLMVGTNVNRMPKRPERPRARRSSGNPMDPRRCVILVPFASYIIPPCERALQELERRGYDVRRVGGYAAIDQGRNQMATDALLDGYEETMWIDADTEFHPDAIDRLRSHNLPIVAGVCAQKNKRAIACHVIPGTPNMKFGREGGLVEVLYAGTGFILIRREVYLTMQERLHLPMCNERFQSQMLPFFHPMLHQCDDGYWYLAEDFAFCERARQSGFKIMVDTTIRLWHVGSYAYGWEDAGIDRERFETFVLNFGPEPIQSERSDEKPSLEENQS
jgi:hypothetical protein